MKVQKKPPPHDKTPDLRIYRDRLGRIRFRPGDGVSHGAALIRDLQVAVLQGLLDDKPAWCQVAGYLTLFEGVCHIKDVAGIVNGVSSAYSHDQQCIVDWLDEDGRQNRRILSPITTALQPWRLSSANQDEVLDGLTSLATLAYQCKQGTPVRLLRDIESYLSEALPDCLLSHVMHLSPITALPKSSLARQTTQLALARDHGNHPTERAAHATGVALDHAFHAIKQRSGHGLVDRIVEICTSHARQRNDALGRHAMLEACVLESTRVEQTDGMSALLLAWVINLIEFGSLVEKNPRPRTIAQYVSNSIRGIHKHFAGKDMFEFKSEEYDDAYARIIATTKVGNRTHCLTGIKTWHAFLIEMFDVPKCASNLDDSAGPVIPNANLIWPHELALVLQWINESDLNERLKTQIDLCIRLVAAIRLRASELFSLSMRNVIDVDSSVEVEVAPLLSSGPPKTKAGRRVQLLCETETIARLLAWKKRRYQEGAFESDLIFGDPYHPGRVYRLGQTYSLINRVLKWATGDPAVSLHTFSHTWASHTIRSALIMPSSIDVPKLELVANAAGHESAQTTITQYFHFPDELIRHFLDQEMKHLKLTSQVAARFSLVSSPALRKRASERRQASQEVYWQAIHDSRHPLPPAGPDDSLSLAPVAFPEFLSSRKQLGFDPICCAVRDLASGAVHDLVAQRIGVAVIQIQEIFQAATSISSRLRVKGEGKSWRFMRGREMQGTPFRNLPASGIDFSRANQQHWESVKKKLQSMESSKLKVLVEAWQVSFDRGYLDLADDAHCSIVFSFIHSCRVSSSNVAVVISCENQDHPSVKERKRETDIVQIFERWFNVAPLMLHKGVRRNRPRIYLVWSSVPLHPGIMPPPAAVSLAGFHALMLCASVCQEMQATQTTGAGS